jgi:hypothetical protein
MPLNTPTAFWELADTSDATGNGHTLTNNGTVTFASGLVGNAADFENNPTPGQYLSRADHADISMGAEVSFSLAFWIRAETLSGRHGLIGKMGANGEYQVGIYNSFDLRLKVWGSTGYGDESTAELTGGIANTAQWYFIVATHDATANEIALSIDNGTPVTDAHTAGVFDSDNALVIGGEDGSSNFFDGMIDQLGLWKGYVLTSGDRTYLYNSGAGRTYSEIAASGGYSPAAGALALTGQGTRLGFAFNMPDEA